MLPHPFLRPSQRSSGSTGYSSGPVEYWIQQWSYILLDTAVVLYSTGSISGLYSIGYSSGPIRYWIYQWSCTVLDTSVFLYSTGYNSGPIQYWIYQWSCKILDTAVVLYNTGYNSDHVQYLIKQWYCTVMDTSVVLHIIQFLKGMYLVLTLQVHPSLPSLFSETDSVLLRADT